MTVEEPSPLPLSLSLFLQQWQDLQARTVTIRNTVTPTFHTSSSKLQCSTLFLCFSTIIATSSQSDLLLEFPLLFRVNFSMHTSKKHRIATSLHSVDIPPKGGSIQVVCVDRSCFSFVFAILSLQFIYFFVNKSHCLYS